MADSPFPLRASDRLTSQLGDGRWWLESACGCGRLGHVKVIDLVWFTSARTLGDLLPRLRCKGCGGRPVALAWVDGPEGRVRLSPEPPYTSTPLGQRRVPIPLPLPP